MHWLIAEHVERLQELAENMASYTLKRDAVRRGLIDSGEENAWRRALVQLVAEPTAFSLDPRPSSQPDDNIVAGGPTSAT